MDQPGLQKEAVVFLTVDDQGNLKGTFAEQPLDQVLAQIASSGATGKLAIGSHSKIWLDTGNVYLVQTPSSPKISDVLFGANITTMAKLSEILDPGAAQPASEALAQMAPDSAPVVGRLLHEHNLNGLFELLVPSEDSYDFTPGESHQLGASFAEPTTELISQAHQRLDIWREIAIRIPNTEVAFRLCPTLPGQSQEKVITADEWRYLSLLDGNTSVAEVIRKTGSSAFRVCSALYRLALEELITEVQ